MAKYDMYRFRSYFYESRQKHAHSLSEEDAKNIIENSPGQPTYDGRMEYWGRTAPNKFAKAIVSLSHSAAARVAIVFNNAQ